MEQKKKILVPWDFTVLAEYALQHAIKMIGIISGEIVLIHIVKKEEEKEQALSKLQQIAEENTKTSGINTYAQVNVGSIFSEISEAAEELDAEMVIMGTHGIKGMQKYLGSWALKVIADTKAPFVVIQEPPKDNVFENILYPINFKKENKETISWVIFLSRYFKTKITILAARYNDKKLKKGVKSNVLFAQKIFNKKGIEYDIKMAEGKMDFSKEIVRFASNNNIDLILVMTTRDMTIADFLIGTHEQYVIANSLKIPVMCINPRPLKNIGGFRAGGG